MSMGRQPAHFRGAMGQRKNEMATFPDFLKYAVFSDIMGRIMGDSQMSQKGFIQDDDQF